MAPHILTAGAIRAVMQIAASPGNTRKAFIPADGARSYQSKEPELAWRDAGVSFQGRCVASE
jgi:hypothetical protein